MSESNIISYIPWVIVLIGIGIYILIGQKETNKRLKEKEKQYHASKKATKPAISSETKEIKAFVPVPLTPVDTMVISPVSKTGYVKAEMIRKAHKKNEDKFKEDVRAITDSVTRLTSDLLQEIEFKLATNEIEVDTDGSIKLSTINYSLYLPSSRISRDTLAKQLFKRAYEELYPGGWKKIVMTVTDDSDNDGKNLVRTSVEVSTKSQDSDGHYEVIQSNRVGTVHLRYDGSDFY